MQNVLVLAQTVGSRAIRPVAPERGGSLHRAAQRRWTLRAARNHPPGRIPVEVSIPLIDDATRHVSIIARAARAAAADRAGARLPLDRCCASTGTPVQKPGEAVE